MAHLKRILKVVVFILLAIFIFEWTLVLLRGSDFVVLNPKGWVGLQERDLIVVSVVLMCLVVVPAIAMTLIFAWKYRAERKGEVYRPEWDHNHLLETIWWGVPFVIIAILSVMTWRSSHKLDPFKPLEQPGKPLTIQAVALQWKWLFIYPEQRIALVNYLQIPKDRPIAFEVSADAPMNSLWIPQLGGQIYAMAGMRSKLHLIANQEGTFWGSSANISGTGFAGMRFTVVASSQEAFDAWVASVQAEGGDLTKDAYGKLASPSQYNPVSRYVLRDLDLFDWIVMKPMRMP